MKHSGNESWERDLTAHARRTIRLKGLSVGLLLVISLSLALILVSCSKKGSRIFSLGIHPKTYLFLSIPDSVSTDSLHIQLYRQVIHWWGEDQDGEVVGYYWRWEFDPACTECPDSLETWHFTTLTSDTFWVPVPHQRAKHTFYVKAVDNEGLEDLSPPHHAFYLKNSSPSIVLRGSEDGAIALPDTSFPVLTVFWSATDPDGDNTVKYVRLWLESGGKRYGVKLADAKTGSYTFVPADFVDSSGVSHDGTTTLYAQAIDDGTSESSVVSRSWNVKRISGRVLLIDDLPNNVPNYSVQYDNFYRTQIYTATSGAYSLLDVGLISPAVPGAGEFRSADEAYALLSQFEKCVWYTDVRRSRSTSLARAESAIGKYLRAGGKLLLISGNAVASSLDQSGESYTWRGSLTANFASEFCNVKFRGVGHAANVYYNNDTYYTNPVSIQSTNFTVLAGKKIFGWTLPITSWYPDPTDSTGTVLPPGIHVMNCHYWPDSVDAAKLTDSRRPLYFMRYRDVYGGTSQSSVRMVIAFARDDLPNDGKLVFAGFQVSRASTAIMTKLLHEVDIN
ncbi:MAG: hypothetical protein QME66_11420 [Candidatus Eisenbacteria bacterium]|nr:hypothetical protein [Candidatus Eisenbacteria bacterium]